MPGHKYLHAKCERRVTNLQSFSAASETSPRQGQNEVLHPLCRAGVHAHSQSKNRMNNRTNGKYKISVQAWSRKKSIRLGLVRSKKSIQSERRIIRVFDHSVRMTYVIWELFAFSNTASASKEKQNPLGNMNKEDNTIWKIKAENFGPKRESSGFHACVCCGNNPEVYRNVISNLRCNVQSSLQRLSARMRTHAKGLK